MSDALRTLQLRQLVSDLRDLDATINGKTRHAQFLAASHGNLDARLLLQAAGNLTKEMIRFQLSLSEAVRRGESMSRAVHRRPPVQLAIGQYSPGFGGELAEIRALSRRLPKDLANLSRRMYELHDAGMYEMKKPSRTPDPTPSIPVIELFNTGLMVIEAIVKFRERWTRAR